MDIHGEEAQGGGGACGVGASRLLVTVSTSRCLVCIKHVWWEGARVLGESLQATLASMGVVPFVRGVAMVPMLGPPF